MTVVCPGCGRHYRIPESGSVPQRVRCRACGRIFSTAESREGQEMPGDASAGAGSTASAAGRIRAARPGGGPPLVLVGDEDREFRDLMKRTLVALGCRVEVTGDGEAAFRFAVARRPDLMVLNVYMTKLLGVAVCEGVKGSPDLKSTRVALVGSVFKSGRFIRHTGNLYGADDYFEDVIPESHLRSRLAALLGPGPAGPAATGRITGAAAGPAPGAAAMAPDFGFEPATGPLSPNGADEPIDPRSEIHRLARIMVSDLKMYHPADFRRAVLERRLSETFREELAQAKELIAGRFPGMPDRLAVLTEALKEQIALERDAASRSSAGSAS